MENHKPLTIDIAKTKEKLKASGRTVSSWGRSRQFSHGTVTRIFQGTYNHQENVSSEYQKILRALKADNCLAELDAAEHSAAA